MYYFKYILIKTFSSGRYFFANYKNTWSNIKIRSANVVIWWTGYIICYLI